MIVMAIEDFFFFWAHKLSHDIGFLYRFHKIHHEYEFVFSLAAEYTHPVDYVLGVLVMDLLTIDTVGDTVCGVGWECALLYVDVLAGVEDIHK